MASTGGVQPSGGVEDGVYGRRRGVAVALERRIERWRCGVGKNKRREAGVRGQDTYMTGGTRDFL